MDVRATIKTDDGALIYIAYTGYNYANAKNSALMRAGNGYQLPASDYYFRSVPVFETSSPKYAWLKHTVAVGVAASPHLVNWFTGYMQLSRSKLIFPAAHAVAATRFTH